MMACLSGLGWLGLYFLVCASAALVLRFTVRMPDEVFRKLLHGILLGSLAVWVRVFPVWWQASLSAVGFAVVVYPVLWLAEHLRDYSRVVTERRRGELKSSLLAVFGMFAGVVAICWGLLGDRWLVLASVYAWGFGDAAAALVGKRFGRHPLGPGKSAEGTAAMFVTSCGSVLVVLMLRGGLSLPACAAIAGVTAAVSAAVELYTPGGFDTITCPVAAMTVLIPLIRVFGGAP